jgi:hypothetical protein
LATVRAKLLSSPYLFALSLSPTGYGLKAVVRVPADASKHAGSFRAVQQHVRKLCGVEIDEACKDPARLCFLSYDPDIYVNDNAIEIEPLPEPVKPRRAASHGECPLDLNLRERVAFELLGPLSWAAEKGGYFCRCPGEECHTNGTAEKHCIVYLEGVPTINCQHTSCAKVVEAFNHQLRSLTAKAESQSKTKTPGANVEPGDGDGGNSNRRKSAATELIELAEKFTFFHDPQDRPFVRLEIKGHTEIWPVESSKFKKLLARTYYKQTKKAINRNALADVITTLAGKACHDGNEEQVFLRIAPHGESILIDLCDDRWREALSVAMSVHNPDSSPFKIQS